MVRQSAALLGVLLYVFFVTPAHGSAQAKKAFPQDIMTAMQGAPNLIAASGAMTLVQAQALDGPRMLGAYYTAAQADIAAAQQNIASLQATIATLQANIAALQANDAQVRALLSLPSGGSSTTPQLLTSLLGQINAIGPTPVRTATTLPQAIDQALALQTGTATPNAATAALNVVIATQAQGLQSFMQNMEGTQNPFVVSSSISYTPTTTIAGLGTALTAMTLLPASGSTPPITASALWPCSDYSGEFAGEFLVQVPPMMLLRLIQDLVSGQRITPPTATPTLTLAPATVASLPLTLYNLIVCINAQTS